MSKIKIIFFIIIAFIIYKGVVVLKDFEIGVSNRVAEIEEKAFYTQKAPDYWLKDLNKFDTDWHKEFLEKAPCLIVIFKQIYELKDNIKYKNY